MSVASITGAIAAMADPPQIPVPALMRLLVFQFNPSALPINAPSPKQVASVKSMTVSEGAALVKSIQDELSASCSPLFAYRDTSPAIDSLVQCCDKCLNSLSLLAGNGDASTAAFSSEMKYALLELSSSYSDMLKSMAG